MLLESREGAAGLFGDLRRYLKTTPELSFCSMNPGR